MFNMFFPDRYVTSTYVIDFEKLYEKGYRGLIFDIDNTLVPHGAPADERAIALFERLKKIETMAEDGTFDVLPKKEVIQLKKEWEKLEKNLGGIKNMKRVPDAIFVVDPKKERICIQEAHSLGITLIGIADTNCDPEELDFVIPGNDDAIRAVKLIVAKMADAVIEANQGEIGEVSEETFAEEAVEETVEETTEA